MNLSKTKTLILFLSFSFLNLSKSEAVEIVTENQPNVLYASINDSTNLQQLNNLGNDEQGYTAMLDEQSLAEGQYLLKILQGDKSEREIGFFVINDLLPGRFVQIHMDNEGFVTLYFSHIKINDYPIKITSALANKEKIITVSNGTATFHNDQFDTEILISNGHHSIRIPLFPELRIREKNIEEQIVENKTDNTLISQQIAELFYEINQTLSSSLQSNEHVMEYADTISEVEKIYSTQIEKSLSQVANFYNPIHFFENHKEAYNWLTITDESKKILEPESINTAFELSFNRKQYNQGNDYDYMLYVTSIVKACCDQLDTDDALALKTNLIQRLNQLGNRGAHIGNVMKSHMFLMLTNSLQYIAKIVAA